MPDGNDGAVCVTCGIMNLFMCHDPIPHVDGKCGRCGVAVSEHHPYAPAPVVPSDDECEFCGEDDQGRLVMCERHAREYDTELRALLTPAPPTPSQDAEGDGRWRVIARVAGGWRSYERADLDALRAAVRPLVEASAAVVGAKEALTEVGRKSRANEPGALNNVMELAQALTDADAALAAALADPAIAALLEGGER